MALKVGTTGISKMFVGTTGISKAFVGTTQVFNSSTIQYILDIVTGAELAYGLRLMKTGYAGNCVKVRRANDNQELDIGFSGANIDQSALETFCAGTDGYVTTWYDQSGNTTNMAQSNTNKQPLIVTSGSYLGGVDFRGNTGADRGAMTAGTAFSNKANVSLFFNVTPRSNTNLGQLFDKGGGTNGPTCYIQANNRLRYSRRFDNTVNWDPSTTVTYNSVNKLLITQSGETMTLYKDNGAGVSPTPSASPSGSITDDSTRTLILGQWTGNDGSLDGLIHEAIFYAKVLDATEINNINTL